MSLTPWYAPNQVVSVCYDSDQEQARNESPTPLCGTIPLQERYEASLKNSKDSLLRKPRTYRAMPTTCLWSKRPGVRVPLGVPQKLQYLCGIFQIPVYWSSHLHAGCGICDRFCDNDTAETGN